MESGDRDISDSYLAIMPPSDFNKVSFCHIQYMNNLDVLLGNTLKYNIVLLGFFKI